MMNRHDLAGSLNLASVQHKRDLRVPKVRESPRSAGPKKGSKL